MGKIKMTYSKIGYAILGFMLLAAVFFHFINMKTFFLLVCCHIFLKACIYFDTKKNSSDNKLYSYYVGAMGLFFFAGMVILLFK